MKSTDQLNMEPGYRKPKVPGIYKFLAFLAVVMTVATVVLAILYGLDVGRTREESVCSTTPAKTTTPTTSSPGDTQEEVCQSTSCISAASRILNAMKPDIDPCNDFFQYACGNWIDDHIIASDQSSVSTFNGLRDDVSASLKRVLEASSPAGERSSIKKAKDFYKLCMNTTQVDHLGITPVTDLIGDLGGWPAIGDAFNSTSFVLEEVLAMFRSKYETYAIISSWVSADDMVSTENIMQLDQPSLGMPNREYFLQDSYMKARNAYQQFMIDFMAAVSTKPVDDPDIVAAAGKMMAFETEIARSMVPDNDRRDSFALYKKYTLGQMYTNVTDSIDWLVYANEVLSVVPYTVTNDTEVVIYGPDYLKNVRAIINGDWETVQNYLVWRVLKDRVSYMSADLRATYAPYRQSVSGTSTEEARWKSCSDTTNGYFPMPVGSLFVQDTFPAENKAVTEQMVEDIRLVFKELLPANDWMDDKTKAEAETKADQVTPVIAYPDYIVDETDPKMDNDYADAKTIPDEYFSTAQNLIEFESKNSLSQITKEVDFTEWITGPAIVNAFYSPSRNQIVFPAGILQPPFYDAGQPNSMNYGGIGMVIGHEITHGFDDSGSQFDGHGNLNNWWTEQSKKNFNDRADCMIKQYSDITWDEAGGKNIDGVLTLGENIADNGGLRETYMAYKKWQGENPQGDLRLPGLSNFTQDQLLFIGYGQVWCSKYTEEYAIRLLSTDPHSPGEFRVVVPSTNFPEFGKAFNCKQGTDILYPNEADTCRVW